MLSTIIGTAAGVAGSLIGGYKASKQLKKVRRMLGQQERDNRNWYDRRMNQDYTQTAAAQDAIRRTREYADQLLSRAEGSSMVHGNTSESMAAARRQAAQAVGNTTADIAAAGDQTRDAVEQQYIANQKEIQRRKMALWQQQAQNISKASSMI